VRPLLSITVVLVAFSLTGCVDPSEGTPSSEDLAVFGVESTLTIRLDDDGFSPDALDLPANSTISVTNSGADRHAVLEVDTLPDRRIETGDLVPGETVDIHLIEPGLIELTDPRTGATLTLDVGPADPVS
jgi:hypothetical protein